MPKIDLQEYTQRDTKHNIDTLGLPILGYRLENNIKVFSLTAEKISFEIMKDTVVHSLGYNNSSPGPVIIAYEGDRIRINLKNTLDKKNYTPLPRDTSSKLTRWCI